MSIPWNKVTAVIDLSKITANYQLLRAHGKNIVPVVKADAYGHGLLQVTRALARAGAEAFAVGTMEEAGALRESGFTGRIVSLLGPLEQHEYAMLWDERIIAFLHCFEQLEMLDAARSRRGGIAGVALKFDTGMGRLGFTLPDVPAVAQKMAAMPNVRVEMLSSHLACADQPEASRQVEQQGRGFAAIRQALASHGLFPQASIANSAALLNNAPLHLDMQRAGIALYGCNPFHATGLEHLGRGLQPAMSVKSKIVSVHALAAGQSVSYGHTYTADADKTVAIVGAGYADAYSRGLSGKAFMCLHGRRVPVLGRVCMQMTAVDVTGLGPVRPGQDIWLLGGEGGGNITPEDLAGWWGTITYEVFCLLGLNARRYV